MASTVGGFSDTSNSSAPTRSRRAAVQAAALGVLGLMGLRRQRGAGQGGAHQQGWLSRLAGGAGGPPVRGRWEGQLPPGYCSQPKAAPPRVAPGSCCRTPRTPSRASRRVARPRHCRCAPPHPAPPALWRLHPRKAQRSVPLVRATPLPPPPPLAGPPAPFSASWPSCHLWERNGHSWEWAAQKEPWAARGRQPQAARCALKAGCGRRVRPAGAHCQRGTGRRVLTGRGAGLNPAEGLLQRLVFGPGEGGWGGRPGRAAWYACWEARRRGSAPAPAAVRRPGLPSRRGRRGLVNPTPPGAPVQVPLPAPKHQGDGQVFLLWLAAHVGLV
jgi:hypothetical protein